ncbi:phosphotransferase [Nonomuraea sediminis]|uniref:phosphotransferase n=1 Tax=Nonomuraea sediminis TaxID=2835864 RepID=UPI001BDC97D1|nr:phosphotransferase [Nonomuraea sediminis]
MKLEWDGKSAVAFERLRGGSKKGAYRVTFDDGASAVLYSWGEGENYWPDAEDDIEPFGDASGLGLFLAAHERLTRVGVRVPEVYFADPDREIALIEDVPGGKLEDSMDPGVLGKLGESLRAMWGEKADWFGKVGEPVQGRSAVGVVKERALRHLDEAAGRDERIGDARAELVEMVERLAGEVEPREDYRLIHGELGPDHVMVDRRGDPVMIDIEGLMFFDLEWEHVFLRLRFHDDYRHLAVDGLDERRMRFYGLAMHLSLVAGPLRLLDGDFPDRELMLEIARYNAEKVLAWGREIDNP